MVELSPPASTYNQGPCIQTLGLFRVYNPELQAPKCLGLVVYTGLRLWRLGLCFVLSLATGVIRIYGLGLSVQALGYIEYPVLSEAFKKEHVHYSLLHLGDCVVVLWRFCSSPLNS